MPFQVCKSKMADAMRLNAFVLKIKIENLIFREIVMKRSLPKCFLQILPCVALYKVTVQI